MAVLVLSHIVCLFMVRACGDSFANPCLPLNSLLTNALERSENCHLILTRVFHTVQPNLSLYNVVQWRFKPFLDHSLSSSNRLVSIVFREACHPCCTFTGFNIVYGDTLGKKYSDQDWLCADIIPHFQCRPQSIQLLRSEHTNI